MSGEQIASDSRVKTQGVHHTETKSRYKIPGRVDINNLMSKVRLEEKKQKKENLLFLSLIASVILITGILASF